jgi:hypothetical protein
VAGQDDLAYLGRGGELDHDRGVPFDVEVHGRSIPLAPRPRKG